MFKNNQALPFFSLVNEGILSVNINKENENPFELQNKIAEKITNNKVRIFENLNVNKKIENLKVEDEKNDKIIDLYYDLIQKELLKKLKEFNYETNDLFPDFADYLDYKSKEFKPVEYDNKLLLKALQGSQTEATNCK